MKILNLGCGAKTSEHPSVTNVDWSILLRIRANPLLRLLATVLLNDDRLARFRALPDNLMVHDLAKGIPFADNSVDVVYHSHVLEHLDRDVAALFISEIGRVLKPGGVLRIVVPNFECYCRAYLAHIDACERAGKVEIERHDTYIEPLLLMSVRREAYGSSQQKPLRRFFENLLLGDARKRGETHQWMYDRFNLEALLLRQGFDRVTAQSFETSLIPDWGRLGLDCDEEGKEYKPDSLYVEAFKVNHPGIPGDSIQSR